MCNTNIFFSISLIKLFFDIPYYFHWLYCIPVLEPKLNTRGRKWKRGICIKKSLFADTFSNPKTKNVSLHLPPPASGFRSVLLNQDFDLICSLLRLWGMVSQRAKISSGSCVSGWQWASQAWGLVGGERSWWQGCSPPSIHLRAMGGRKGWFTHPPYSGWQRPPKSLNGSVWVRVALPDRGLGSVIYTLVWGQA